MRWTKLYTGAYPMSHAQAVYNFTHPMSLNQDLTLDMSQDCLYTFVFLTLLNDKYGEDIYIICISKEMQYIYIKFFDDGYWILIMYIQKYTIQTY